MPKVVFAASATNDIKSIVTYTKKKWGKAQAVSYVYGLKKQTQILAEMPTLGKIYAHYHRQEIHFFPFEKHLIYYFQENHGITIIHVTHKSMQQSLHIKPKGTT